MSTTRMRFYRTSRGALVACDQANKQFPFARWEVYIEPHGFRYVVGYRDKRTNRIVYLGKGKALLNTVQGVYPHVH